MNAERNLSIRRMFYILTIFVTFLCGTWFLAMQNTLLLDELICVLVFDVVFLSIFVIRLMRERISGALFYQGTSYYRFFILFAMGWIIAIAGSYLDDYLMPIGLLVFWLASGLTEAMALEVGLYFVVLICLLCGRGTYSIFCYCLILAGDAFFAGYFISIKEKKIILAKIMMYLMCGLYQLCLPIMFYYLNFGKVAKSIVGPLVIEAVCVVFFVAILFPWLITFNRSERRTSYDMLLEEDYPLLEDLRRFSESEYFHAIKVYELCSICAKEINIDVKACAAGGLYYRIGKMLGSPEIENAVKEATNRCFPPEVIAILEEYEGEKRLPQTPESAIVHMVNALVERIELMDNEEMENSWNEDMLIYQTLNEFSNTGVYDQAKLSMNQFLRIREKLVQEGIR